MRGIIFAVGLLLSVPGFALEGSGSDNQAPIDPGVIKSFQSACQSFCNQYGEEPATCEISLNSGQNNFGTPSTDENGQSVGAYANGTSVSLNYAITCKGTANIAKNKRK